VLDIEHRPLVASKKTKLGIEKLSVLQAPYQLNVQPNLTDKVVFWGGDSSSLRMPALINESIKLITMNQYVLQRVSVHLSPTHYDDKFKTLAF